MTELAKHTWKSKIHEVIYEADTPAGKIFDVILLIIILLSVVLVMLESVAGMQIKYGDYFYISEWIITIFFTIEYILRVISIKKNPSQFDFEMSFKFRFEIAFSIRF